MTWTLFWDMHSGGSQKEQWGHIYIEAPEDEARVIFYNRFGHNPERVTCTCCGEDYSISSHEDLRQLSGFHRGCRNIKTPRGANGLYQNDDSVIQKHLYLEEDEQPPEGYEVDDRWSSHRDYQTMEQYAASDNVLIIPADNIKPEEREGSVPAQGYVWVGGDDE
ncbi:hypothetical protein C4565_03765 [Candidatus Parcubacteria bacterium]|nr:MAG: hypothetical protein C4565_03765 [Candidatus Parcubacteria bacterium]